MPKDIAARIAKLQRQLEEAEGIEVVIADFARPTLAPPRERSSRPVTAPVLSEPEPNHEPRCPRCGAQARPYRGELVCLTCMEGQA